MTTIPRIELTQGLFALVDEEDFEWLSQWKWCAMSLSHTSYAKRTHKAILMHRVIMSRHTFGFECVDHINHNGLDNRKVNLREASAHDNAGNRRKTHGGSRFKGVHLETYTGRWRASFRIDGKVIKSARMDREEDAAAWYNTKAKEYFGDFALLNILP